MGILGNHAPSPSSGNIHGTTPACQRCAVVENTTRAQRIQHTTSIPTMLSDRMFIEIALYQAPAEPPWRDLPDEFGDWNTVCHRLHRWEKHDLWKWIWQRFQGNSTLPASSIKSYRRRQFVLQ